MEVDVCVRGIIVTLLLTAASAADDNLSITEQLLRRLEHTFSTPIALRTAFAAVASMYGIFPRWRQTDDPQQNGGPYIIEEGTFSLSKQIGLMGLNQLITEMSTRERKFAMEATRAVYCDRMAACKEGRHLVKQQTMSEALRHVDMNAKYLDSILMGMGGTDCERTYRGCTDFH